MNEPQVIKAVFYNWRPVVGHKRLQLIFEVPLEETSVVLKMLGAPMPDKETWCAIALLNINTKPEIGSEDHMFPDKERHAFCDLPFPQQCGIKTNDPAFQQFMVGFQSADACATAIRNACGVDSRSKILPDTEAGERWLSILRDFEGIR